MAWLRRVAKIRARWGRTLFLLPVVLVFAADVAMRGSRLWALPGRYWGSYAVALIESGLLWGLLLFAASRRRGVFRYLAALLFAVYATCAWGCQIYFHASYSTYLNLDATLWGNSVAGSVFGQLKADGSNFLTSVLPPFLVAVGLLVLGRRLLRPRRTKLNWALRVVAPLVAIAVLFIPCSYRKVQASTPDVIYFHAMGGLSKELLGVRTTAQIRPGLRTPPKLPAMSPARTAGAGKGTPARNVIFVLTESVRADVACSAYTPSCPATPETNAALPDRIPLPQLRSSSSTTAIQLAVLWSGLEPSASREALHSAPLVYDFARASGIDNAYWTSHHMMFANSRLYVQDLPTSHRVGATDLDPEADIDLGANDAYLTERVKKEIGELKEPFLAVVHYGNTHVPYLVDKEASPFQPSEETKDPDRTEQYKNYYKNAVFLQDKTIGDFLRFVKQQPFASRTVILYTSDHAEAFREHGQIGHTGAILEEEVHVPGFIDAPEGTLSDAEREALNEAKDRPLFHIDFAPTILDLMGLWDAPGVAPYRATMKGDSLLRPLPEGRKDKVFEMTNCSGIWGCAYKNWGVMQGSRKVEGREWYPGWRCFDVLADPAEQKDLGAAECGDLMKAADRVFGEPPGGR